MTTLAQPVLLASFVTFGDLLKYLRRRERLTQLELSIAVGYSEAQISRLEKNQRLPDLASVKALFISALHLQHEPEFAARLLELAQSARQEDGPAGGVAPYKGLLFFDVSDAEWFFGREALTAHLVERVSALAQSNSPRFLAVVGASGSGKSSVVRAGLVGALQLAGWKTRVVTPNAQPLQALAHVGDDFHSPVLHPSLLVVDQFEEVFTLCHDEPARAEFIEKLLALANQPDNKAVVLISLRADFYSHCAHYPELRQAIASQQEYIGQMSVEELRRAIEEPAKRGAWKIELGLVEVVLRDIGAEGAQEPEPGALPLLSHALLATWERRRGRTLTLEGYRASGGVRGAIAETAESVYTDQFNQQQKELARAIFMRLTELGQGTEDTRRRAPLAELVPQTQDAVPTRAVLHTLSEARLVSLSEDSAVVAHEALIREWQRLRDWLNQDREGLQLHRRLTEAAQEWEQLGHDSGALFRGARLAQAREWAALNSNVLNMQERAFLQESQLREMREIWEKEEQQQRELESAQQLAAHASKLAVEQIARAEESARSAKRLRRRAYVLASAFALALVLAGLALFLGDQARTSAAAAQENAALADANAKKADANALRAQSEERIATARELAASAVSNLTVDPERSILLALQAVNLSTQDNQPVLVEAQDALHRAIQESRVIATLRGHDADTIWTVALSRDGKRMATLGDDRTARIWDLTTNKVISTLPVDTDMGGGGGGAAFSPDGNQLLTVSGDKSATLWDVTKGKPIFSLDGHSQHLSSADISPDGKTFATGSDDGTAKLWDATSGKELHTLADEENPPLYVAFSPDGKRVYAGSDGHTAIAWDVATGKALFAFAEPGGGTDVTAIAASPDGTRVATGDFDTTVKIWDAVTGKLLLKLFGHASYVNGLAFSPDGKTLATASEDGTVRLWDAETGKAMHTFSGHTSGVLSVAFSPDGERLYSSARNGTARIWDLSAAAGSDALNLVGHTSRVATVAYRSDGKQLATLGWDGTVRVWDAVNGKELRTIKLKGEYGSGNAFAGEVAYSPDGKRLAYNELHATRIIDATSGAEILTLDPYEGDANGAAFSPDGTRVVDSADGKLRVHDAANGKTLVEFPLPADIDPVWQIAFSPDGKRLAIASSIGAYVYDAATGKQLLKYGGHGEGVRSSGIAFSPDSKWIASSGNDSTIKIWDSETGADIFTLTGHTGPTFGVVFGSDGRSLTTSSVDRTVKVWQLPKPGEPVSEPLTLYGNSGAVYRVALSPDGTRIVSVGRDPVVRVYSLNIAELINLAKTGLTRTLTAEECQKYLHTPECPGMK